MTVDEYRAWKVEQAERHKHNKAQWAAMMAVPAEQRNKQRRERDRERCKVAAERRRQEFGTLTPLTHKGVAFLFLTGDVRALVDASDWHRAIKHKWHAQHKGTYVRAKRSIGGGVTQLLNRFVVDAKDGQSVCHRNGNQLDCRRNNLCVKGL
jgi:hypothetical protein